MGPVAKLGTYAAALAVAFAGAWSLGATLRETGPAAGPVAIRASDPAPGSGVVIPPHPPADTPVTPGPADQPTTVSRGGTTRATDPTTSRRSQTAPAPVTLPATAGEQPSTSQPVPETPPEPAGAEPVSPSPQPASGCGPDAPLGPVICTLLGIFGGPS